MNRANRLLIQALAISALAASVHADRTYPKDAIIEEDVTWTAGETITVQGTLWIRAQVDVEPGVTVRVGPEAIIELEAILNTFGTADAPVRFLAERDAPDAPYWGGILSYRGHLSLLHTNIAHARNGLEIDGMDPSPASAVVRHCLISDIRGQSYNATMQGHNGWPGKFAFGISVAGPCNVSVTDTRVVGISGGPGAEGGTGFFFGSKGGDGGPGGQSVGLRLENTNGSTFEFERNEFGFISGGPGGDGGNPFFPAGDSGNGGNSGEGYAVFAKTGVPVLFRNCTFHHVQTQAPGNGGLGDTPGSAGVPGPLYGVWLKEQSLTLEHCTFDAIGETAAPSSAGVSAQGPEIQHPTAMASVVNCSFSNMPIPALYAEEGSQVASDHCNFFNTGTNAGPMTVLSPFFLDPEYVSAPDGLYALTSYSGLIDQGAATSTTDDLTGAPRDAMPDIGAYEYAGSGRAFGDFDNSGCSDLYDFFFFIDHWQAGSADGAPYGLGDFLALVDHWWTGPRCR